jgi:hypothetical protein
MFQEARIVFSSISPAGPDGIAPGRTRVHELAETGRLPGPSDGIGLPIFQEAPRASGEFRARGIAGPQALWKLRGARGEFWQDPNSERALRPCMRQCRCRGFSAIGTPIQASGLDFLFSNLQWRAALREPLPFTGIAQFAFDQSFKRIPRCRPARYHPALPQVPAALRRRPERQDGKRDLYFQHAA